jgi:ZIP family zinc transporter
MMDNNVIYAFLLTLFAGLTTGVGSIIGLFVPRTNTKFLSVALGFSAGVMLYISFIEMFANAQEYLTVAFGEIGGIWFTCGAFFFGMVLIMVIIYWQKEGKLLPAKPTPLQGMNLLGRPLF